jgi:CO/xanthine dehydrogenase Mo-binding subunit
VSQVLSRRRLLSAGALVVAFSMNRRALAQLAGGGEGGAGPPVIAPGLPGSLKFSPLLESWVRIDAQGRATVFTGKAELGQGIRTALWQVAAEELDLPPGSVEIVTADTARTPDEGLTAGSHSMQDSGTALRIAAANVRMLLTRAAAERWGLDPSAVATTGTGQLRAADGRVLDYGPLAAGLSLQVEALPDVPLRAPADFRSLARSLPRLDIPAKVTGGQAFLQDLRLPGMLHARVVRGPSFGTRLRQPDWDAAAAMPGILATVRDGSFAAIVAQDEWQAVAALRRLQDVPHDRIAAPLAVAAPAAVLQALPARRITILDQAGPAGTAAHTVRARYSRPWLSHGSIGPSCAMALFQDGHMTIWTHSQGAFDVKRVAADLLGLPPERVQAIHVEGSGCYGQNGADDVAAEAARIAFALPGRPIRLQWMREQEFGWEPLGPAMATELEASLDASNRIIAWRHDVWSNPHNNRPVDAGGVLVGREVAKPFPAPEPKPIPMPEGDGSRNSNPLYALPDMHVTYHFLPEMPLRVSALRSLGAHLNVFSIESMFDELAAVGDIDPLALRLAHMQDMRARGVMQRGAEAFGWAGRPRGDGRRGCGMGFARYKNLGAYCAVFLEAEVERESGRIAVRRAVAAVDCGQVANPDGVRNQIEGAIIQSLSWATQEEMPFDAVQRTGFDWSSYPILRFEDVPDSIEVHLLDQPGQPFLGAAEAGQGPASAAVANALRDATGQRMRDMPLSPARVKQAIGPI